MFNFKYRLLNEEPGEADGAAPAEAPSEGNWYDSLPEEMRGDQNITKFDSVEAMGKSWLNAQRLIGADKIPMPQTDEDWGNVYNRLGRPEDATGYKIDAPEGVEVNADMQGAFLSKAHELGLNQKQVEGLAAWQFEQGSESAQASEQASEQAFTEAMNGLKAEWGNAFEQNANIAIRAAGEFLGDQDKAFLESAKVDGVSLGDHPTFLKLFNNVGKQMMEGSQLEGLGSEMAKTPQEIEDERNTLMAHPSYMDRAHPEHKQTLRKVQEMFKQQYGG
jgi:hypothetical protein